LQQWKRERSTNITVTQICIASNLSATQPRIISTLPSPSIVHLHVATTTIEDPTSPPSFPLQRRRVHLCTSNQIRDHHGSSGDVSSIAVANQNNANNNHVSTHQRREHSFNTTTQTQQQQAVHHTWGLRRENWGRR